MGDIKTVRCTHCGAEFTDQELAGVSCCPKCGTTGLPCAIADDVTLKINWHELRILGMWADNWTRRISDNKDSNKVVAAILARLEQQYPNKTPLTLTGEVRQIQTEFPSAELICGDDVIVPQKKTQ